MIRFLADANLNEGIVTGCLRRQPRVDFMSANQVRLEGVSDPAVLALAADQDRPCLDILRISFKLTAPAPASF